MTRDPNAPVRLTRRSLLAFGMALAAGGMPHPAEAVSARRHNPAASAPEARGSSVYLLRGFAGVFSAGLDAIETQLRSAGVDAHIGGHLAWRSVADAIVARQAQAGGGPVILIGHSLGANAAISIAEMLEPQNIGVRYLATFAATAPDPLPGNVERAVNFFFSRDGWGEPLVPGPRFRGRLENRDFAGSGSVGHFNIDKQPALQSEVVRDTLSILER